MNHWMAIFMTFSISLAFADAGPTGVFQRKAKIYHEGWIDLNKNGVKDPYEDPALEIETRISDLLSKMTVEEKTCQMATLYGYGRVLKDALPTEAWKNEIWKDGIANVDEHLNGFRGWGHSPSDHPNCSPASAHAEALNEVQRFFIEDTRLGIPVDFTDEGIRGIEAVIATNFPTQLGIGHTWNRAGQCSTPSNSNDGFRCSPRDGAPGSCHSSRSRWNLVSG